jgi:hypothetical protein
MKRIVTPPMVKRLAGLELNALLYSKILPKEKFHGARIASSGTPIYDVNGEVLFYRAPIKKGRMSVGYVDIAAHPAFNSPLLAVSQGLEWKTKEFIAQAITVARKKKRGFKFSEVRFVAYSYPKIAVQFLRGKKELLMLELGTWKSIPTFTQKPKDPNFQRGSLIEETPAERKQKNLRNFNKRLAYWDDICPPEKPKIKPEILRIIEFEKLFPTVPRKVIDTRELHYSPEDVDHHPCYELRGQLTSVWCVPASVQMILDFYRYNYLQTRIAAELDQGTLTNPRGLPYSRDGDVVTVLEDLTSNALDANMNTSPNWAEFRDEIRANRPLISFIPRHSRTVAGYTNVNISISGFFTFRFRGLLVYDPWPPSTTGAPTDGGVITRWENFDTHTYRRTFKAELNLV